jgi:hypothetical protein
MNEPEGKKTTIRRYLLITSVKSYKVRMLKMIFWPENTFKVKTL